MHNILNSCVWVIICCIVQWYYQSYDTLVACSAEFRGNRVSAPGLSTYCMIWFRVEVVLGQVSIQYDEWSIKYQVSSSGLETFISSLGAHLRIESSDLCFDVSGFLLRASSYHSERG